MVGWKEKLASRKLWTAIVGVVSGVAMVFGASDSLVGNLAGAIMSFGSVVAYLLAQGKVDAAAALAQGMAAASQAAVDASTPSTPPVDETEGEG